ncbi:MAG: aromatic ring-hydroxylating dioxygenase subunit alpha [Pyrinomonadaceae bacterium]
MSRVISGRSLPGEFYHDREIFEMDMQRIFRRCWLYAGHESRIPERGDFFTWQIDRDSLIITRGRDGEINALFNSCRHRGSIICTEPFGRAVKLICPYHQWAYDTDGSLTSARLMPDDFDKSQFALARAHVRTLEGLIFVCLSAEPPPFELFSEAMLPRLLAHELTEARVCHQKEYSVDANWKLVAENSRECYHCGAGHPQYVKAVGFAAAIGSKLLAAEDRAQEEARQARLSACNLDPSPVPFAGDSWYHCRRFYLRDEFLTESLDGKPVAPLMGRVPGYEAGVLAVVTLPNLLLEVCPDYAVTLRVTPSGPLTTRVNVEWLVHKNALENTDFNLDRLTAFWRLTGEQDWKLCADNQLGVNSSAYRPGPYGPDETGVRHFVDWYLQRLIQTDPAAHSMALAGAQ